MQLVKSFTHLPQVARRLTLIRSDADIPYPRQIGSLGACLSSKYIFNGLVCVFLFHVFFVPYDLLVSLLVYLSTPCLPYLPYRPTYLTLPILCVYSIYSRYNLPRSISSPAVLFPAASPSRPRPVRIFGMERATKSELTQMLPLGVSVSLRAEEYYPRGD